MCELDEEIVLPTYLRQVAQIPASEKRRKTRWSVPVRQLGMRAPGDYLHVNVRLADFGEAQESSGGNLDFIQPNTLRAPEVILRTGWGPKADIWSLACIVSGCHRSCREFENQVSLRWIKIQIWEIFERRIFFDGRILATDEYSHRGHLREMVFYFGPPPRELVSRSVLGGYYFDDKGTSLLCGLSSPAYTDSRVGQVKGLPPPTWKHIWEWEENLTGQEQKEFIDFLKSMLCWMPEERLSAKQLLEHPWLVNEEI